MRTTFILGSSNEVEIGPNYEDFVMTRAVIIINVLYYFAVRCTLFIYEDKWAYCTGTQLYESGR